MERGNLFDSYIIFVLLIIDDTQKKKLINFYMLRQKI